MGISPQTPTAVAGADLAKVPRAATMISHTSALKQILIRIGRDWDKLFSKMAFYFWFVGEGSDSGSFQEARENLNGLEKDLDSACGKHWDQVSTDW